MVRTNPHRAATLAAAQGGQVTLQFFNEATNSWQSVPSTVNPVTGELTATITHFSKWALIVIKGGTISGTVPAAGGYGLIVYGGGTLEALITATGCPRASMAIAAVSTVVEWYDFTLYLYLVTVLARVFYGGGQGSLLAALAGFAVSYLMRPLGALALGLLGDRHGRRRAMMTSMAIIMARSPSPPEISR